MEHLLDRRGDFCFPDLRRVELPVLFLLTRGDPGCFVSVEELRTAIESCSPLLKPAFFVHAFRWLLLLWYRYPTELMLLSLLVLPVLGEKKESPVDADDSDNCSAEDSDESADDALLQLEDSALDDTGPLKLEMLAWLLALVFVLFQLRLRFRFPLLFGRKTMWRWSVKLFGAKSIVSTVLLLLLLLLL